MWRKTEKDKPSRPGVFNKQICRSRIADDQSLIHFVFHLEIFCDFRNPSSVHQFPYPVHPPSMDTSENHSRFRKFLSAETLEMSGDAPILSKLAKLCARSPLVLSILGATGRLEQGTPGDQRRGWTSYSEQLPMLVSIGNPNLNTQVAVLGLSSKIITCIQQLLKE